MKKKAVYEYYENYNVGGHDAGAISSLTCYSGVPVRSSQSPFELASFGLQCRISNEWPVYQIIMH